MVKAKMTDKISANDSTVLIFRFQVLNELVDDLDVMIQNYVNTQWEFAHLSTARDALLSEMKVLYNLIEKTGCKVFGSQREKMRREG